MPRPLFLSWLLALAVAAPGLRADDETDPYANDPYWYRPGHPVTPADATAIETLPGFTAEKILAVPERFGSWTALCADPRGRLIAAAQHRPGLYRIAPAAPDQPDAQTRVEPLGGPAADIGWCQGLLYAHDALYVTVAEDNDRYPTGLYRLQDTDGDDQFDRIDRLFELPGSGEHGPHNLVADPRSDQLYLMCGNGTQLPALHRPTLPNPTTGIDRLQPPGFASSQHSFAGYVLRFDPDGANRQVFASGLRNAYDLAFDQNGELFTFDSDMEWDLGTPWYRPTRVYHVVSGSEFGWREDGAAWPEHYEDASAPVLNVGPASPTGMLFGHSARFPADYQRALFVADWTFATIHAIHLQPDGASFSARSEQFLGGAGLPITDLAIASDGFLYFAVGGRRLGSALYRVRYTGDAPVDASPPQPTPPTALATLRRQLETLHLDPRPEDLDRLWPYLGHPDRAIRFAARVALEKQPPDRYLERALHEHDVSVQLSALLALARQADRSTLDRLLDHAPALAATLRQERHALAFLRICELVLARSFGDDRPHAPALTERLRHAFPHASPPLRHETARLRAYLGDAALIEPALQRMAEDTGQRDASALAYYTRNRKYGQAIRDMLQAAPLVERMRYAQTLLWIENDWTVSQRARYFELIADAAASSRGGHWYLDFWQRIRQTAWQQLDDDQRERLADLADQPTTTPDAPERPAPIGPGQDWTLDAALQAYREQTLPRDLPAGRRAFAAAACLACHRIAGQGAAIGPDLSSLGQRFTPRDILEATIDPNKAVSDQYRMTLVTTRDGQTLTGRVIARDDQRLRLAPNLLRPTQSIAIPLDTIASEKPLPLSTMPEGLLDPLNQDELLDLLAFLLSGGDSQHPLYQPAPR